MAYLRNSIPSLLVGVIFALGLIILHFSHDFVLGDELLGVHLSPWIGNAAIVGSVMMFFIMWLNCHDAGLYSIIVFCLGAAVSLHYLTISNSEAYTNDLGTHWYTINFILENWSYPFGYGGHPVAHPPLYYYIAACVHWIGTYLNTFHTLASLRFFSWICYLVFAVYSLLTLRKSGVTGMGYYSSVALLLLWPAGFHLATKISSEILYFPVYAAAFYYLVSWYQQGSQTDLIKACVLAGLALAIRRNAFIILAVIGIIMFISICRRRMSITQFFSYRWMLVVVWVAVCFSILMAPYLFYHYPLERQLGFAPDGEIFAIDHYLSVHFGYTLKQPFNDFTRNQSFWDFFLKTAMFGEYTWPSPQLAVVMHCFLMAIIAYALVPWLFVHRVQCMGMLPHVTNLMIPLFFILYYSYGVRVFASHDARYVYPALVSFIVFYGRAQQLYKGRDWWILYWLGSFFAAGFSILSIVFFWCNAR